MAQVENSALSSARARFIESLPGRALELSGTAERLARDPRDVEALDALRRRLHTLLASAQVFEERALGLAVTDLIARLDRATQADRSLPVEEIDAVIVVVQSLPTYIRPSKQPPPAHSDVHELRETERAPPMRELPTGLIDARPNQLAPPFRGRSDSQSLGSLFPPRREGRADSGVVRVVTHVRTPAPPPLPPTPIDSSIPAATFTSQPTPTPAPAAPSGEHDVPVPVEQTVSGLLPAPRLAALMFVDCHDSKGRLAADLPETRFEIAHAATADEAVRMLHAIEPDLVFVSAELASRPEVDLVRRLKTDPLVAVSAVYVLLPEGATHDAAFLRQTGADAVVREPIDQTQLSLLLARHSTHRSPARQLSALREGTVDEIANQVAEEIRRGIASSLKVGRHERVRVGDGTELMAAAWSAIGRVRSHLAEQNRGRMRFREDPAPVSLLPSSSGSLAAPPVSPAQLLAGCRVLVADDDPAVLWFFVGLLREASAQVMQAHNGREALELARRKQPHVVISDILMPKLDGFGLCRELKRDGLLAHVPVILLSWKDDLLERMRELDSGATGYLRKEAGSKQILTLLADVLRPRTQLRAGLRAHAPVVGAIETGLGVPSLLELVAQERPDARMVVRDAWSIFEVELRGGRRLAVTRTAADGGFTRGAKALMQLLGLSSGRFEVSEGAGPLRAPLAEPLDRAVVACGRRLSALLDAVSDTRLLQVSLIAFDDEILDSVLSAPSTRLREVVALFRTGHATAETVLREGGFSPGELEGYLRELARRLAITGVWNAQGEDLVASSQRAREPAALAQLTSSLLPARPPSAPILGDRETPMVPFDPIVVEKAALSRPLPAADSGGQDRLTVLTPAPSQVDPAMGEGRPTAAQLDPVRIAERIDAEQRAVEALEDYPQLSRPTLEPPQLSASSAEPDALLSTRVDDGPGPALVPPVSESPPQSDALSAAEVVELEPPLPKPPRPRGEGLRLFGTLAVLVVVGYLGWRGLMPSHGMPRNALVPAQVAAPASAATDATELQKPEELAPQPTLTPPLPSAGPPAESALASAQLGRVLPFIDPNRGVRVGPEQGLLVVEYAGEDPAPTLRVGERELGRPPLAVALPAGRHEIVLRTGADASFRFLNVRAGETRVIQLPLAGH